MKVLGFNKKVLSIIMIIILVSVSNFNHVHSVQANYSIDMATLSSYDGVHPKLFLDNDLISAIKSNIANPPTDTLWSQLWVDLKGKADSILMTSPPTYYEGSDLTEEWQRPVGDHMVTLAMAYLLAQTPSDKAKYLEGVRQWALASCSYPSWGRGTYFEGIDLAAGHQLFGLAIVYDWCYDALSVTDRATIFNKLSVQGAVMCTAGVSKGYWRNAWLQNHMWVCMTGLTAAGLAIYGDEGSPDVVPWLNVALNKMVNTMMYLGEDGASHEGYAYWEYGIEWLLKYMDMAKKLMNVDMHSTPWFNQTANYALYLSLPLHSWTANGSHVDFADDPRINWNGPDYILRGLAKIARQNGNIHIAENAQWLANRFDEKNLDASSSRWLNLLWYDPTIKEASPVETATPTLKWFDDMDIVVSRSGWDGDESVLAFKCGPFMGHKVQTVNTTNPYVDWGGGHAHPDAGHFVLFGNGEWLLKDDGYSYKYTAQHNTLLINGQGQLGEGGQWFNSYAARNTNPRVIKCESIDVNMDYMVGDVTTAYDPAVGLIKFYRHILHLKSDNTVIVVDDIEVSDAKSMELRFFPESQEPPVIQDDGSYISIGKNTRLRVTPLTLDGVTVNTGKVDVYDRNNLPSPKIAYRLSKTAMRWQNAIAFTWSANTPATIQHAVTGDVWTFHVNKKTIKLDISHQKALVSSESFVVGFGNFYKLQDASTECKIGHITSGNIKYVVDVSNTEEISKEAVIVMALYRKNQAYNHIELVNVMYRPYIVSRGTMPMDISLVVPTDSDNYLIKVLMWDGFNMLLPLMKEERLE